MKDGLPSGRNSQNKDLNFPFMCFQVTIVHSMSITVNHSPNDGIAMFERIAEKLNDISFDHLLSSIHSCGHFNVHHKEWLVPSNITSEKCEYYHDFFIIYKMT